MGSSCSADTTGGACAAQLPTTPCPQCPSFQLSAQGAREARENMLGNFDEDARPSCAGWELRQCLTTPGKPVFVNAHTGEALSWVPLEPAAREASKSPDIAVPKCHRHFRNHAWVRLYELEMTGQGYLQVRQIVPADPDATNYWGDASQTQGLYVVGVNGNMVPQHESIDEFNAYLVESYRNQGTMHVLFAAAPGAAGFLDNYSVHYKRGGRWAGGQAMDYGSTSSASVLD